MKSIDALEIVGRSWDWLFSLHKPRDLPTAPADVLLRQCHITSKCRYNASIRLRRLGRFTFLTTTLLSLGLILVPMLQLANIRTAYPTAVLNSLQVFLAVAVLVFSVVSATANYDTRARVLNDCADRIKDLSRELRNEMANGAPDLPQFAVKYSGITRDSEMHTRADYALATLQAHDQYNITGLKWAWTRLVIVSMEAAPYALPASLLAIEAIVVLDVLGITSIWTPFLSALILRPS